MYWVIDLNYKYIFMLFVIVLFFSIFSIFCYFGNTVNDVKYVYDSNDLKCKFSVANIAQKEENREILVYYPVTEFANLNRVLDEKRDYYIDKFKTDGTNSKLSISFDSYEYEQYVSFVFNVETIIDGAHGNSYIDTVNFDTKKKKVCTIDDFLLDQNLDLSKLSSCLYDILSKDKDILKYGNVNELKQYLNNQKDHYSNFYIKDNFFVVCFNEGTVASKVAGIFAVPVAFSKLSIF